MDLDVSDLNAQLAFFRKEMKNGYKKPWKEICNSDSYDEVTEIFLNKIEIAEIRNLTTRSKYSATILKYMKSQ